MVNFDFGKYKGIIASIALFLILDASVLTLNFYISFEIADDAVEVNMAGRQRMLSQRMMKSLLDLQASQGDVTEQQRALDELIKTTSLFDTTLQAFDVGGSTSGGDGNLVSLGSVSSVEGRNAINQAKTIWGPYSDKLAPLLSQNNRAAARDASFAQSLEDAIQYGNANNLSLLALMNTLTLDLEKVASSKATTLRWIQTVGISLAIINFFIILFHFIRQLRESDEKIEAARQETQEILTSVNEGLFLLDESFVIGEQHSSALKSIFNRQDIAGISFDGLLKDVVTEKDMDTVHSFIRLLFKPSINENLISDLNPLNEVEINLPKKGGGYVTKFLSFSFKRTMKDIAISHVLVTVLDVTESVKLAKDLETSKQQNEKHVEMLAVLLHINPELLAQFLDNSYQTFNQINEELRIQVTSHQQYLAKATAISALVHNFKGEASALELHPFTEMAHQFEDQIVQLKDKAMLSGNDFLALTVQLDQLIAQADTVSKVAEKLMEYAQSTSDEHNNVEVLKRKDWSHLQQLASNVAGRQSKQVELLVSGFNDFELSNEFEKSLNTISLQLIRNSIVHGLETPEGRIDAQKSKVGVIDIRLMQRADGAFQFVFKDDGQGLDLNSIRNKALASGLINRTKAEAMDAKQVVSLIFTPDLSTSSSSDEDSGRGIGMHLVREEVKKLRGRIAVSSKTGLGCGFTITIPAESSNRIIAA
jgi:signal transduction histidine kinase